MTDSRHRRAPAVRVRAFLAAVFMAVLPALAVSPADAKSLPPVSLMWQVDSTDAAEGVHGVALTISARVPFEALAVEIRLPTGVSVVDGDTAWNGPLATGEAHTVALRVRAARPAAIHAKISGKTASNVHFSTTVTVHVPEQNDKKPASIRPDGVPDTPRPPAPAVREQRSR